MYENTWSCGELKLYFSPFAGGLKPTHMIHFRKHYSLGDFVAVQHTLVGYPLQEPLTRASVYRGRLHRCSSNSRIVNEIELNWHATYMCENTWNCGEHKKSFIFLHSLGGLTPTHMIYFRKHYSLGDFVTVQHTLVGYPLQEPLGTGRYSALISLPLFYQICIGIDSSRCRYHGDDSMMTSIPIGTKRRLDHPLKVYPFRAPKPLPMVLTPFFCSQKGFRAVKKAFSIFITGRS